MLTSAIPPCFPKDRGDRHAASSLQHLSSNEGYPGKHLLGATLEAFPVDVRILHFLLAKHVPLGSVPISPSSHLVRLKMAR